MGYPHFANSLHETSFLKLLKEDATHPGDRERIALFYIMSGHSDLYRKRSFVYNFKEHSIINCFENGGVDFSSGIKSLIRLGFNLYNGYMDDSTSPATLFYNLDDENRELALNAISIRFI